MKRPEMNNFVFALLLACAMGFLPQSLFAQQDAEKITTSKNIFKVYPQHFIVSTFQLGYERFFSQNKISISAIAGATLNKDSYDGTSSGFEGELQLRYYPNAFAGIKSNKSGKNIYQGAYAGLFVRGGNFLVDRTYTSGYWDPTTGEYIITEDYYRRQYNSVFYPGFMIGYQRTILDFLILDLYVGGGMRVASVYRIETNNPSDNTMVQDSFLGRAYEGIMPKIGMSLGAMF